MKIEGNFGSSIYNYDLLFPKFRSLVSMISLSYSSSNGNTEMGQGWNLHIPYIQREIHKGIPTKNTAIEHSADGSLITQNNIDFRPRNSGSFAIYKLESDNSFSAIDTKGNRYNYGNTENSKIVSSYATVKWYLNSIEDSFGNKILYQYQR